MSFAGNKRLVVVAIVLICAGCATDKETQDRAQARARTIESILSEPLDAAEYGETERCLSQYRHIRILDGQTLVFEGRRKKLWLNQLPMRCPGLRRNSVLLVNNVSAVGRICKMDSFAVADWFDWPWYRRWPWRWGSGVRCALGEFQPVTELQVQALEDALSRN